MIQPPSAGDRQLLGRNGEDAVARWYENQGYTVVARNWRVREGEIDIVVRGDRCLVFCEVKTRSSLRFGSGREAVTITKQRRIRQLATRFLQENDLGFVERIRFDVAAVMGKRVDVVMDAF